MYPYTYLHREGLGYLFTRIIDNFFSHIKKTREAWYQLSLSTHTYLKENCRAPSICCLIVTASVAGTLISIPKQFIFALKGAHKGDTCQK